MAEEIELQAQSPVTPLDDAEPPLTEPIIVNCAFITGCAVEAEDYTVRIVAWERTMGG
jgi:hypothetical protein